MSALGPWIACDRLTQTHNKSPHDDNTVNVGRRASSSNGLTERTDDDNDQLKTVHSLSTNDIGEITEQQLTAESTDGVGDLDTKILVVGVFAIVTVDIADHGGCYRDGEDVILRAIRQD